MSVAKGPTRGEVGRKEPSAGDVATELSVIGSMKKAPERNAALREGAVMYARRGDIGSAEEYFERINGEGNRREARLAMGVALAENGDLNGAEKQFDKVDSGSQSRFDNAYAKVVEKLLGKGEIGDAIKFVKKMEDKYLVERIADKFIVAMIEKGKFDEAEKIFDALVPGNMNIGREMVKKCALNGEYERALRMVEKTSADPQVLLDLIEIKVEDGVDYEKEISKVKEEISKYRKMDEDSLRGELHPDLEKAYYHADVIRRAAMALARDQRTDEAIALADQIVDKLGSTKVELLKDIDAEGSKHGFT